MDRNARVDLTPWNVFQEYFVERGLQKHKLDLSPYVDTALLDSAIARLGREQ